MAKTVVGLFDSADEAHAVVTELEAAGYSDEQVSVVANDTRGEYASDTGTTAPVEDEPDGAMTGAATGATTGGAIGAGVGLLASLGALAIPGFGPVLVAGPLMATLVGAGIGAGTGAVAGGLVGALVDVGIPEEEAGYYQEGVRRGGTLVTVFADDDRAEEAAEVMRSHNVVDIRQRGTAYRAAGWDPARNPALTSGVGPFVSSADRKEMAGVANSEYPARDEEMSRDPSVSVAKEEEIDDPDRNHPGTTNVY